MKNKINVKVMSCLTLLFILSSMLVYAGEKVKNITRINNLRVIINDDGHQSESRAAEFVKHRESFNLNNEYDRGLLRMCGTNITVRNWNDVNGIVNGTPQVWPYMVAGAELGASDLRQQFAIPDQYNRTILQYRRYMPAIVTQGLDEDRVTGLFPVDEQDIVDPAEIDKYSTTADAMFVSDIGTWIGLSIKQRVLFWSQKNHDDYVIYDMTFKNTGNTDKNPATIELPGQTLDSVIIMRTALSAYGGDARNKEWASWSVPGPGRTDSIRMHYSYDCPENYATNAANPSTDDFGRPAMSSTLQWLRETDFVGEATLFASGANRAVNDPAMPRMISVFDVRMYNVKDNYFAATRNPENNYHISKYGVRKWNFGTNDTTGYINPKPLTGVYADPIGNGHQEPPDNGDYLNIENILPWGLHARYHTMRMAGYGPYQMPFGDSVRIVYAIVVGKISKRKGFEVARAWYANECTPPDTVRFVWNNNPATNIDNLPPQYHKLWTTRNVPAYRSNTHSDYNNWAKACWIMTGKDSLFQNAWNAKKNFESGYKIATAPPPPSPFNVSTSAKSIKLSWGTASGTQDLAGYALYRAQGSHIDSAWIKIAELPPGTYSYVDTNVIKGPNYYYYITAFSNPKLDVNGKTEVLESNMLATKISIGTTASDAPSDNLDSIRVVPNPFSTNATRKQFTGSGEGNKIMFKGLPGYCTIRIFTESGDLVTTIKHESGLGDEVWGLNRVSNTHMTTSSGMRVVSGLYIAQITTLDGRKKNVKFLIVR